MKKSYFFTLLFVILLSLSINTFSELSKEDNSRYFFKYKEIGTIIEFCKIKNESILLEEGIILINYSNDYHYFKKEDYIFVWKC